MITPAQCLEARKLLGWTPERLAPRSGLSHALPRRFETGAHPLNSECLVALQRTLEAAGVIFVEESSEGSGVRLRKQTSA
jgi:hypothetical protein